MFASKKLYITLMLLALLGCQKVDHPRFQPPLPSICDNFLYFKSIDLSCYEIGCMGKKGKVHLLFINKETKNYSYISCHAHDVPVEDGDGDSETCWFDVWLWDTLCIA